MTDTLYDLWLMRVDGDPTAASDALAAALEAPERVPGLIMSTPSVVLRGVPLSTLQAVEACAQSGGLVFERRPSRAVAVQSPPAAGPEEAAQATSTPDSASQSSGGAPPPGAGPRNVEATPLEDPTTTPARGPAKPFEGALKSEEQVAYHAALVAAPLYVLHPSALLTILGAGLFITACQMATISGLLTVMLAGALLATGTQLTLFSVVVRRSAVGKNRLNLWDGDADFLTVVWAGLRFTFVTLAALIPWFLFVYLVAPAFMGLAPLASVLVLCLILLSLPGAYASASLGSGCNGLNPLVGCARMMRIAR